MMILNRARGTGKTNDLVTYCFLTKTPLIVFCEKEKKRIKKEYPMANHINIHAIGDILYGRVSVAHTPVQIDELEKVMQEMFRFHSLHVETATITIEEE